MVSAREQMLQQLLRAAGDDPRIVGLVDYGSGSEQRADAWSDLDVALFIRDADLAGFAGEWKSWAAQFGPLLLAYVGGVGHPWAVYDTAPLPPLRVDFAFHPASMLDVILSWPNAPASASAMVLYDNSGGRLTGYAQQLVGRYLGPADLRQTFESVCGDLWYYLLRTWSKLQRGEEWSARYDFNHILVGNLLALLRIECGAVERWRSTSAASGIEQALAPRRLAQLNSCVPGPARADLLLAFRRLADLAYEVSAAIAQARGWPWPQTLAERVRAILLEGALLLDPGD